ncbi:MAG: ABC transporter permease, partial [Actinomycetota bacterium]
MWRATWKSLLARKVRLGLTVLAIVLGVGFVSGTYVLTDTLNAAFTQVFSIATGSVDVVVRSTTPFEAGSTGPGGGRTDERAPVPESLLATVQAIPGVAEVHGEITGYAQMVDVATGAPIETSGSPTLGVAWNEGTAAVTIREGRPPVARDETAIDVGTAETYDIAVGDPIDVIFVSGVRRFTVVGTIGFGESDSLAGTTIAAFDVATAQRVLDRRGEFDTLSVMGDGSIGPDALRRRIAASLPEEYEAVTGQAAAAQSAEQLQKAFGFFGTALLVFAAVALFVGAFIIFNTFSIVVAQRVRELALLRALGASRSQVRTSVLVEALIVGVIASGVGVGAGILIAFGLQGLLSAFGLDLPTTSTQVLPRTVAVSFLLGTGITLLAALLPARRASRVAPIQALRAGEAAPQASLGARVLVGILTTALGIGALLAGLFADVAEPLRLIGGGAAATFLGVAVLSPLFARRLAAVIGAPMRRLGVSGRLGRENAMRAPRRTASTASALMIGLGLVAFVGVFAASLRASFLAGLQDTLRADYLLSTTQYQPFSPALARALARDPSFAAVSAFRLGESRIRGEAVRVEGIDPATVERVLDIGVSAGAVATMGDDGLAVLRSYARTRGWQVGDEVRITFARSGRQVFTIRAIFDRERALQAPLAISLPAYRANFAESLDLTVGVGGGGGG